ncbi:MAG: hypothetical protein INR70_37160 [Parafilimonas terrae]|nr:hypothetical protein [Parafilimonas terrae]
MPLNQVDFAEVAKAAANASFGETLVKKAHLDEALGSDGDAVRRVQLIVRDGAVEQLGGEKLLDAGLAISDALRDAGEPLRVTVEYAEQRELDELGAH